MRARITALLMLAGATVLFALPASAQIKRPDAIWARTTNGAPITLDGVLSEPQWAAAESVVIRYGYDSGIPGSGFKSEGGFPPTDSTYAVLKFLTVGNKLYMAAVVRDSSVGGSYNFNQFDGFLINIRDHSTTGHPAPDNEYTYTWWWPNDPHSGSPPGESPGFIGGRWGIYPPELPRTPAQIAAWNAVTVVNGFGGPGMSNQDQNPPGTFVFDKNWTTEMVFDLAPMGYNLTQPGGDIVEFNISIYDADWSWPATLLKLYSSNRVWWEGPWSNTGWYSEVRVHSSPTVTVASGAVPPIGPELIIPNAGVLPVPTIDGVLNDPIWASAPSLHIQYDNQTYRDGYPGVAKWRAGQYQPPVDGNQGLNLVLDPNDVTMKYFFKGDKLYLGFDVPDQVVQYINDTDRMDAVQVTLNDRSLRGPDYELLERTLTMQVGPTGQLLAGDYLIAALDSGYVQAALKIKPGTTVDTLGLDTDTGYQAEMAIDLTKFGYPHGLGDGVLFMGVTTYDGDSFTPFTDSYGSRTWWYRERSTTCCASWLYMDPTTGFTAGVGDRPATPGFALIGNAPNPFNRLTQVRYSLPQPTDVTVEVYDLQGRLVSRKAMGIQQAGVQQAPLGRPGPSGLYLYRVRMADPRSGAVHATLSGKMMLLD
jgi:hypothetical protein